MPSVRKGSSNPSGHDDPAWYEKPGETVLLDYRPAPGFHVAPSLPWQTDSMADRMLQRYAISAAPADTTRQRCTVCGKPAVSPTCPYCERAQSRHEHDAARRNAPA